MSEERQQLARGLVWLGSATAVARILDALSLILVLRFLTREQIGVATLAWSVAVFVECFNGLGIGTATLQQPDLTPRQTSSAFWYATGIAAVLSTMVVLAAPWIADAYRAPELTSMIRVSAMKLVFVGLAAVPLALLAREMRYRALGAVTTLATLVSGLVTLGLAAAGAGAWAPLLGNVSNGLMQLLGASVLCGPYSRREFDWESLRGMAKTGLNISGSVAVVQLSRNLDYLLLGRLVSTQALGGYRVAFDLAMAPSIAILQVGNRTALPVYSRLGRELSKLNEAWLWTARTVTLMTVPVMALIFVDGENVLQLLGKSGWPHAGDAIRLLLVAAFMRGIAETIPSVYVAAGKSRLSLVHSVVNLLLVALAMFLGLTLTDWDRVFVISLAWVAATVSLVAVSLIMSKHAVALSPWALLKSMGGPVVVFSGVVITLLAVRPFLPANPGLRLAIDVALVVGSFVGGLRVFLGVDVRTAFKRSPIAP
ncbi:MAG: oligosaccharide flippase family protein [Myxococcales bacterium]